VRDECRRDVGALHGLLGDSGTQAIDAMLKGANRPREGIVATVIGVGALVFAAVGVVVQLKDALNTVWETNVYARRYGSQRNAASADRRPNEGKGRMRMQLDGGRTAKG
jgi:uncharacterized BrkB/YihY/UPF0761 family membrane protein